MHDDGHQHVEEDGGKVLDTVVEVVHSRLIWSLCRTQRGHTESLQPMMIKMHLLLTGDLFGSRPKYRPHAIHSGLWILNIINSIHSDSDS